MPTERNHDAICRHYAPISHNDECEAGIAYGDLAVELDVHRKDVREVCMGRRAGCDRYQPYTKDEIAADDASLHLKLEQIRLSKGAVLEHVKQKKGAYGKMSCPICITGILTYSIAQWDANLTTGKCTTPTCVNWSEY